MKRKKYIAATVIILFCSLSAQISSQEGTIRIGSASGWSEIRELRSLVMGTGTAGKTVLLLEDGQPTLERGTDLLLNMDHIPGEDLARNYLTETAAVTVTQGTKRYGRGAGVFRNEEEAMVLSPKPGALLYPGTVIKDFSIDFWIYPASASTGETIFLWQGGYLTESHVVRQSMRSSIENRQLVWEFDRFFYDPGTSNPGQMPRVTLKGHTKLIPRTWSHHLIRFDADTGLIEYLMNGIPEAVAYANNSGSEGSQVFYPLIGQQRKSELVIGSGYTGLLDSFRISSLFREDPLLTTYPNRAGEMITEPVDLGFGNSTLLGIEAGLSTPSNSGGALFFRTGNTLYEIERTDEWRPVGSGTDLSDLRTRYVQVMAQLYPSGDGTRTPALEEIIIRYIPDLPPLPPTDLTVVPGNGKVSLSWTPVDDSDLGGYLVYYGTQQGRYFGKSSSGNSPIDAGTETSLTVDGLENGTLYYFSVISYDAAEDRHRSNFSREVSARPLAIYGSNE